jgi:hypothetical protein
MRLYTPIILLLLFIGCRSQRPGMASLAGHYYRGDGLGYNLYLNLASSGTYKAEWRGCLGVYGTANGIWSLNGEQIVFSPSEETGMMEGHLRELHIVKQDGQAVFVPDLQDDYYQKHGPDRYSAFHEQKK